MFDEFIKTLQRYSTERELAEKATKVWDDVNILAAALGQVLIASIHEATAPSEPTPTGSEEKHQKDKEESADTPPLVECGLLDELLGSEDLKSRYPNGKG